MKHKHAMVSHMNQQQLAEYWGISTRTLERWRSIGWVRISAHRDHGFRSNVTDHFGGT